MGAIGAGDGSLRRRRGTPLGVILTGGRVGGALRAGVLDVRVERGFNNVGGGVWFVRMERWQQRRAPRALWSVPRGSPSALTHGAHMQETAPGGCSHFVHRRRARLCDATSCWASLGRSRHSRLLRPHISSVSAEVQPVHVRWML